MPTGKAPTTVGEVAFALECVAPRMLAAPGDNVGLLIGDPGAPVRKVLIAGCVSDSVTDSAVKNKVDLVISHEPVIPRPLASVATVSQAGRAVSRLIKANIASIACRTNLQAAAGGLDDYAADALNIVCREPVLSIRTVPRYKLVVFVPPSSRKKVHDAICRSGAGGFGNYTECTFRTGGTGTFRPGEGAHPAVGSVGRLEEVAEERLETMVPQPALEAAIEAMLAAHPYEEPAYDVYEVHSPYPTEGFGRIGSVDGEPDFKSYLKAVKKFLGVRQVTAVGRAPRVVRTAAYAAGEADLIAEDIAAGECDIFITGEMGQRGLSTLTDAGVMTLLVGRRAVQSLFAGYVEVLLRVFFPAVRRVADHRDGFQAKTL